MSRLRAITSAICIVALGLKVLATVLCFGNGGAHQGLAAVSDPVLGAMVICHGDVGEPAGQGKSTEDGTSCSACLANTVAWVPPLLDHVPARTWVAETPEGVPSGPLRKPGPVRLAHQSRAPPITA